MKIKNTLAWMAFLITSFLLINSKEGPGAIQDEDRTGSPLSSGACNVGGCHDAGAFNPSVALELLKDNVAVDKYQPGESYKMKVTITAGTGTPAGYGFQAVALKSPNNTNAGTWGTPPSGVHSVTISNGRTYVEHSTPQTTGNFFEVEWTAPTTGTGDVTFYAGGNAVNLNDESTGDGAKTAQLTITEEIPNSVNSQQQLFDFAIFPNPVQEDLQLKVNSRYSGEFEWRITNTNGQMIQSGQIELYEGQNNSQIDVSNLENGLYLLQLVDGKQSISRTLLKM